MEAHAGLAGRVETVIRDALNVDVPTHETDLIESGLLDSLALVSLIVELETELAIELPLDDLDVERFRSVSGIAELLAENGWAA